MKIKVLFCVLIPVAILGHTVIAQEDPVSKNEIRVGYGMGLWLQGCL